MVFMLYLERFLNDLYVVFREITLLGGVEDYFFFRNQSFFRGVKRVLPSPPKIAVAYR